MSKNLTLMEFADWVRSHNVVEHSEESVFCSDDSIGGGAYLLADDGSRVTIELGYEGGCASDPGSGDYVLRFLLDKSEATDV